MDITNKKQLRNILEQRLKQAMDNLTEKIYKKLLRFIEIDVYKTYPQPKMYDRTFEFKELAWNKQVKKTTQEIVGLIFYDGMNMTYNPAKYQHGSRFEDNRERLAEILNNSIKNPDLYDDDWVMGRDPLPEPYWDHTIQWLENGWDNLVKEALKSVGLR